MTWITPSFWPIIFYLSLPISLKRRHRMITLSSSSLASFWSPLSYYTQSHLTSVPGLVIEVEILLKGHHLLPRPASRLPCLAVLQLGKKVVNTTFVTTRTSNLKEDRLHVSAGLDLLEQVGGHVRVDIPQVQLRQAGH